MIKYIHMFSGSFDYFLIQKYLSLVGLEVSILKFLFVIELNYDDYKRSYQLMSDLHVHLYLQISWIYFVWHLNKLILKTVTIINWMIVRMKTALTNLFFNAMSTINILIMILRKAFQNLILTTVRMKKRTTILRMSTYSPVTVLMFLILHYPF